MLRAWLRSLLSGETAGEALGCLGDCTANSDRGFDPAATGGCGKGFGNARVVGIGSGMRFRIGTPERDGALNSPAMTLALQGLQQLSAGWHEIDPSDEIRETAARFLRVHPRWG